MGLALWLVGWLAAMKVLLPGWMELRHGHRSCSVDAGVAARKGPQPRCRRPPSCNALYFLHLPCDVDEIEKVKGTKCDLLDREAAVREAEQRTGALSAELARREAEVGAREVAVDGREASVALREEESSKLAAQVAGQEAAARSCG